MSYNVKSKSKSHTLVEHGEYIGKTSGIHNFTFYKQGRIVVMEWRATGSVSSTVLTGITPSGYEPIINARTMTHNITGTLLNSYGVSYIQVNTDGSIGIMSTNSEFLERRCTLVWITKE